MNFRLSGAAALAAAWLALAPAGATQAAGMPEPDAARIDAITARAGGLLADIQPAAAGGAPRSDWKLLEREGGSVRWGNFLRPDRIAALVTVTQAGEETDSAPLRHDVCFFEWENGRWVFRQFLGNADDLALHERRDTPSLFLCGSFRTGRYEGEYVSWFFDEKTGRFVRTGFETWGPFYLPGDYLVSERGFERLGHDSTWWIHRYVGGRKGALLTRFHQNDSGSFDISFPNSQTGDWESWIFTPDDEDASRVAVNVVVDRTRGEAGEPEADPDKPSKQATIENSVDSDDVFARLTGLDPILLEERWDAELPPRAPGRAPNWEIRGDAEIVKRLGGSNAGATEDPRARLLRMLLDLAPGRAPSRPELLAQGDIRGVWGCLFGGGDVQALLARGMAKTGSGDGPATLYHFRWNGKKWDFVQEVGKVSPDVDPEGNPGWTIRRHGTPAEYFVLGQQDRTQLAQFQTWRYDPATRALAPTGWPRNTFPAIAGGTITFAARDPMRPGNPLLVDAYRYAGKPGAFLGSVLTDFSEEGLLRATLTAPDKATGRPVTWRLWKQTGDHLPQSDEYALCRDENGGRELFRADATITFDWDDDFAPDDAARYLWWRLTKTGVDSYLGAWRDGPSRPPRMPRTAKVAGLPEAVEKFTWPENKESR